MLRIKPANDENTTSLWYNLNQFMIGIKPVFGRDKPVIVSDNQFYGLW